jgi:hypothetical protein
MEREFILLRRYFKGDVEWNVVLEGSQEKVALREQVREKIFQDTGEIGLTIHYRRVLTTSKRKLSSYIATCQKSFLAE